MGVQPYMSYGHTSCNSSAQSLNKEKDIHNYEELYVEPQYGPAILNMDLCGFAKTLKESKCHSSLQIGSKVVTWSSLETQVYTIP